jgi:hypothetical protein
MISDRAALAAKPGTSCTDSFATIGLLIAPGIGRLSNIPTLKIRTHPSTPTTSRRRKSTQKRRLAGGRSTKRLPSASGCGGASGGSFQIRVSVPAAGVKKGPAGAAGQCHVTHCGFKLNPIGGSTAMTTPLKPLVALTKGVYS